MDPTWGSLPKPVVTADNAAIQTSLDDRLGWLKESLARARQWYGTQRSTIDQNEAMDIISGLVDTQAGSDTMSDVRSSEIKRNMVELIAELSNLRAEGQVRSDDKAEFTTSAILQKRYKAWFQMNRVKRVVKNAIAWAVVLGQGWLVVDYDMNARGPGKGDHRLRAFGPHQVLPDGLGPDANYQDAYAVHLIEEMPLHKARQLHPLVADQLQPDRGMPTSWLKRITTNRWLAPVLNQFGIRGEKPDASGNLFPTIDIIRTIVNDGSINMTGKTVTMGDPGTSWTYDVPSFGSEIKTGINDEHGNPLYRKANEVDALLYPRRREIIWTSTVLIRDDTQRYWHGKLPAIPVAIEKWPWDANGTSQTKSVANLQRALTRLMRYIEDSALIQLDPPLMYDESLVSDSFTEKFNPRQTGVRIKSSAMSMSTELIKPIIPAGFYQIQQVIPDWVKYLEEKIKRYLYVSDVQAVTKARQIPSGDALDKMIEMAGPVVRDMLEGIEMAISDVGDLLLPNFFQYDRASRRLELLGEDGVTKEDFDYDPSNLIPSHLQGEDPNQPSAASFYERGVQKAGKFSFYITPGSLHDLSRSTQKLMLIQAIKGAGLKLDQWTIAKTFAVEYYGPEPEGTHTVIERLMAEERMREEAAARMAEIQAKAGGGEGQGRKPTNQKPPHIKQKDGGTRSTVVTS